MQKITFTNALGRSVSATYALGDYFLNALEGIGGMTSDIRTEKAPNQDGESVTSKTFKPRDISFELGIQGSMKEIYAKREVLHDVFNPALGPGELTYENDGHIANIKAEAIEAPDFPSNERYMPGGMHIGIIRLRAIEAVFFEHTLPGYQALVAVEPEFEFPLELTTDDVLEFGTLSSGTLAVNNVGHVPAPIEITIYGPVATPRITNNTTGEFIELKTPLLAGEKMVINTDYGDKTVIIYKADGNQENAFQYLNIDPTPESPLGSTFFNLVLGENELQFTASAGSESALVEVRHWLRYVGY